MTNTHDDKTFNKRDTVPQEKMDEWLEAESCKNCICANVDFCDVIKYVKENSVDWKTAMEHFKAGADCEVCVPYLKRAVETGNDDISFEDEGVDFMMSEGQGVPTEDLTKEGLVSIRGDASDNAFVRRNKAGDAITESEEVIEFANGKPGPAYETKEGERYQNYKRSAGRIR